MKYFGFLLKFVILPLAVFTAINTWDSRRGKRFPASLRAVSPTAAAAGLATVAVAYTTPWDNYLVATRVWWYDPKLVNGLILGYVPIEEYSFFVLQTLLIASWVTFLARRVQPDAPPRFPMRARVGLTLGVAAIWLWSTVNLLRGPKSRTYLTLTLSWALLPIMFQTAFGGDILWQHRKLIALGVLPATLYLGLSDSLAIDSGTWTINPEKTVNTLIGGKLPLEEGLFFFLTNVLVALGMTLVMAGESQRRVPPAILQWLGLAK